MMRDTRTLKGLFAEPQPPRHKNFIKENVKSVRQMEKLFHANDKNIKVLKPIKVSSKHNGTINNHTSLQNGLSILKGEDNGNELAKLLSKKLYLENQNNRKKSAPVFSSKKTLVAKKLTRPSIHTNVLRKSQRGHKDQANYTNENKQKLKSHSVGDIGSQVLKEPNDNNDEMKFKSQGVQTLDVQDIESLYLEGIIRYPSGKIRNGEMENSKSEPVDMISDQLIQDSTRTNKGSISIASKLASQLSNRALPSSYRVGVVPKYIKERKEALQKEQLAKISAKQSDCHKGHVPLPDCERKETLNVLKKNYQEYVLELNTLPIRTDTLRSQKRKMEIERQLAKLEEAIKVFSRPKVFVKLDS